MREGDTILVHVTAFKGRENIQNQQENRECVVEWQPYPNLPIYVVCPRKGEGCRQTLHRNYLLPISNNLEQTGDEPINKLTPVPPADGGLSVDVLTGSWPESLPGSLTKQHLLSLTWQDHPPQTWWVMTLRLVRTILLNLGRMHVQWVTNCHRGTRISHFSKIPPFLVPSMYGMVSTLVCTMLLGKVQCKSTQLEICQTWAIFRMDGIPPM